MADNDSSMHHVDEEVDRDEYHFKERFDKLIKSWQVSSSVNSADVATGPISLVGSNNDNDASNATSSFTVSKLEFSYLHQEQQQQLGVSPARGKFLPPIGVFWDIENCQVSSTLLRGICQMGVQCSRFFSGSGAKRTLSRSGDANNKGEIFHWLQGSRVHSRLRRSKGEQANCAGIERCTGDNERFAVEPSTGVFWTPALIFTNFEYLSFLHTQ